MRKHKIRKILHGLLDLLPLIVIPVFMIYSHRHTINDYSVVQEGAIYELKQEIINGKPTSFDNWSDSTAHFEYDMSEQELYASSFANDSLFNTTNIVAHLNDVIYCQFENYTGVAPLYNGIDVAIEGDATLIFPINIELSQTYKKYYACVIYDTNETQGNLNFEFNGLYQGIGFKNIQLFNLTQIFGSGNEPTADEFASMIGGRYFDYGETYNVFLPYGTTTYNNTDIGSQFIYSLYNTTTQYFNTDSVFNLKDLHSWIENNMFKGSMPLGVTIVYHIVVYEFIMDIIFLIYAVLMFVVDFATDFLEYCFSWSRRGGR